MTRAQPREMYILRGPDGIDEVLAKLKRGPLAVDTETSGLRMRHDRVGSINLAAGDTAVFAYKGALRPVIRWLSDQVHARRTLVFHEAKYDLHMLRETFGFHVPYPVHDTKIESRVIDQRGAGTSWSPEHSLKPLAQLYVDPDAQEPEKELMKAIRAAGGQHKGDWLLAPRKLYARYSALDAWYTLQLHDIFWERIRAWPQPDGYPPLRELYETEQWVLLALRDMEERGIRANAAYLETWKAGLEREARGVRKELRQIAGRDINWRSTPQLRDLLFGELGLKPRKYGKTGPKADKNFLVSLTHPIGAALLRWRKLDHSAHTEATSILNAIDDDGAVHCNFNQIVDTGRMSCMQPNLQGQDRKSGVRKGFIPRDGLVLRMADYSQGEMRLAAHFSEEPSLVHGFNTDPDFDAHTATAARMFGRKAPSDDERKRAKDVNFATIYGAGENKQTEMLMERVPWMEAVAACKALGRTPGPAENPHRTLVGLLRQRFMEVMPSMKLCARDEEKVCATRGFVINAYGRLRYLHEDEAYKSFNTKIQGTLADVGKRALAAIYRELQLGTGELALLLQVHDELIYESEGNPRTDARVLELMNETKKFKVPIVADMSGSDTSWQDKQKITLTKKQLRCA